MPTDVRALQFSTTPVRRHGDGSFEFKVIVFERFPISEATPPVVGTAEIFVKDDKVCSSLAEALRQIAAQLPPEIALMDRN